MVSSRQTFSTSRILFWGDPNTARCLRARMHRLETTLMYWLRNGEWQVLRGFGKVIHPPLSRRIIEVREKNLTRNNILFDVLLHLYALVCLVCLQFVERENKKQNAHTCSLRNKLHTTATKRTRTISQQPHAPITFQGVFVSSLDRNKPLPWCRLRMQFFGCVMCVVRNEDP